MRELRSSTDDQINSTSVSSVMAHSLSQEDKNTGESSYG